MKEKILIALIFILALILRINGLAEVPPSLYWDEVSIGYNAYSLSRTGADEYNHKWPLLFESFNDFKMPGYFYSLIPFIKIFGLSDFIVRLPSAIYGILTVIVVYFLVKELFYGKDDFHGRPLQSKGDDKHRHCALLSMLLLAISPWHIQFSRAAFEVNSSLFWFILGVTLLLTARRRIQFLPVSAVILSISLYFYYSQRIMIPLIVFLVFVLWKDQWLKAKKWLIISIFIAIGIALPLARELITPKAMERLSVVSLFHNKELKFENYQLGIEDQNTLISSLFHHRYLFYSQTILKNYLSHSSPDFLFFFGDPNGRHSPRGMGLLYVWEIPFFLLGFYQLIKSKNKNKWLIFVWFFSAPIPAALSLPAPHALRSLLILPMPQIITAYGILQIWQYMKSKKTLQYLSLYFWLLASGFWLFNFIYYLDVYYVHYPQKAAADWADGHRQLWDYLKTAEKDYDRIIITGHYWQPYIFGLYYLKYNPELYQTAWDHGNFGKYYFERSGWDKKGDEYYRQKYDLEKMKKMPKTLIVAEKITEGKLLKVIYNKNGEKIFYIQKSLAKSL